MSKTVTARGLRLGEGRPKVCLPVCGADRRELEGELAALDRLQPDLIEWRADAYTALEQPGELERCLELLRARIGALPLLLTVRMAEEGGNAAIPDLRRAELYLRALAAGGRDRVVDLIDIELAAEAAARDEVVRAAREAGAAVILSHHNFADTPEPDEMLAVLRRACEAGADIAKLAVTPNSPDDLLSLLGVTLRAGRELDAALITISMGETGMLSRIGGGVFGSAVSYGCGRTATAPGQIDSRRLRELLELLHPNQNEAQS